MTDPLHETASVDDLLARARTGDAEAENVLFAHLHARVLALAKKKLWDPEAARDIAQETLRTAFEKYRDAELPHGFFPWLFTILHHKVGNYLKRCRTEQNYLALEASQQLGEWQSLAASGDDEVAYVDLRSCIDKALRQLSVDCQKIFRLLLEGARRTEICAAFAGETIGTIDSRVSRCRARLFTDLEALQGERKRS